MATLRVLFNALPSIGAPDLGRNLRRQTICPSKTLSQSSITCETQREPLFSLGLLPLGQAHFRVPRIRQLPPLTTASQALYTKSEHTPEGPLTLHSRTSISWSDARRRLLTVALVGLRLTYASELTEAPGPRQPNAHLNSAVTNVIFDTDIWSDMDDMLALAMLHALEDRGEIRILAVTISTNDRWCASYVSLVNTFYDHAQIPIGMINEGMDVEYFRKQFPTLAWPVSRYTELLSERRKQDGTSLYAHRLNDGRMTPEAVGLLRETLTAQPDGSVVMIQVGYSTNLARLLRSDPDAISMFNGRELIARKVRFLSIMAGNFGETLFEGKVIPKGSPEFNLEADVTSAQALFANWPTPIVASGFEIGINLLYPPESITRDFRYSEHHPIPDTYRTLCNEELQPTRQGACSRVQGTPDLTAVLYAVRPDRNYFSLSNAGRITVLNDGSSSFEEVVGGRHRHLILHKSQKARALEAMVMLASQPPTHHARP